jgi:ATP-dependent metalloprotease
MPEKESYHVTKRQLLAMMDTMMGGRAAEEIVFGIDRVTSGAANDLKVTFPSHIINLYNSYIIDE